MNPITPLNKINEVSHHFEMSQHLENSKKNSSMSHIGEDGNYSPIKTESEYYNRKARKCPKSHSLFLNRVIKEIKFVPEDESGSSYVPSEYSRNEKK
jgi:hypothetical protein